MSISGRRRRGTRSRHWGRKYLFMDEIRMYPREPSVTILTPQSICTNADYQNLIQIRTLPSPIQCLTLRACTPARALTRAGTDAGVDLYNLDWSGPVGARWKKKREKKKRKITRAADMRNWERS